MELREVLEILQAAIAEMNKPDPTNVEFTKLSEEYPASEGHHVSASHASERLHDLFCAIDEGVIRLRDHWEAKEMT